MVSPLGGIIAGISLRGDWLDLALFCAICSIFIGWWRILFAFRRVKKGVGSESQLWRDAMNIARCSSRSAFSVHGSMLRDSYRSASPTEEKESVGKFLQRDADYWIPEISAAEMIETKRRLRPKDLPLISPLYGLNFIVWCCSLLLYVGLETLLYKK